MNIKEEIINGLYFRTWKAENPRAAIILIHGLGEHCQRYDHVAKRLIADNYTVMSMDLPGHGKSEGPRGHINSFDRYEKATMSLLQRAEKELPQIPKFLIGHSMGGLIASHFLLENQDRFKGAILSGPAIQSPQEPPAWQVAIIRGINSLFPKAKMIALDAQGVSRDPAVVEAYMNDPLVSKEKLTARFLVSLTDTMDEVKRYAKQISLPLLIMHGSEDVMTSPKGSELLYETCGSQDKTCRLLDGLYHEIMNEPEQDQVISEIISWLHKRS